MDKKINDVGMRAFKTFVEAFLGVLIPQICLVLANVFEYDWSNFWSWGLPIITGALSAGFSAAWNGFQNWRSGGNPELK